MTPGDFPALEALFKNIVKEKQKFERLVVRKEDLLEMFKVFSDGSREPISEVGCKCNSVIGRGGGVTFRKLSIIICDHSRKG